MEVCADGSGENDSHIINLMGSSDLNLVDTSMLPSDPRDMMDLVRSGDHDEESLSTSFASSFSPISINSHSSFPCSSNLTYASTLSPITCSVSLSASSISSVEITLSPPTSHTSSITQGLAGLPINHSQRSAISIQQQLPLTSPPLSSSHQSPPYHQDVSSSSLDTSRESHSSQHTTSPLHSMPPPMQTPPLHHQDFQSSFYPNSEASPSLSSKTFQGSVTAYTSNGGYSYTPTSLNQPTSPILSPSEQHRKRSGRGSHITQLKREPDEFSLENKPLQALSPSELDSRDQPPYSAFGHLNITSDEVGISSTSNQRGTVHRNSSRENDPTSPLMSPLRSPPCNVPSTSRPGNAGLNSRYPTGYVFSSPSSGQMILDMTPNNSRLTNQVHLQQQTNQQAIFQPVQLHSPTLSQQTTHLQHPENINLLQPHQLSISLNGYDETLHNDSINSVCRNLPFNYSDILSPQTCQQPQQSPVYQQFPYSSKVTINKEQRRRNTGTSSANHKGNEENFDNYSSDSDVKDSDEDNLVIDTSNPIDGYECGECKQVFKTRGNLRKHLSTEHSSNEPEPAETVFKDYKCTVTGCNYITKFRNEYDEHVSEHVAQGWTPTGKKRHNKNPLLRHRYNKEEFHCPHCEYSCTVEKAFNRHLSIHENPENSTLYEGGGFVSCVICGKDRPSEAALRIHMNKHRKGKKYKCDICNFVTVQLKKLIQHRRMHTGEKPHLCPFCVYRAARRDNLRSHVRRMHKKSNMYGDTFTPRPLIVAQVEASNGGARMPHHSQSQIPLMTLGQHSNNQQIQQHQNHSLLERLQQQPTHQGQVARAVMVQGVQHQNLGLSALSPHGIEIIAAHPDHHQVLTTFPSQHSPHSLLNSHDQ